MAKRCPVRIYDQEVENYVNYLEGQEDRLRGIENVLNTVEKSTLLNRDNFMKLFKEFQT